MKKWVVHMKKADFTALGEKFGIDPVVARIMRNRNLETDEQYRQFLYGKWENLHDAALMKGMDRAVALMKEKADSREPIRIIGDYDIDGINASYILYRGLKRVGADVDYAIPHRMKDGYGINEQLIGQAHEAGRDTVITCDNGIAAREQIAYAKQLGMTVIVTDHHEVPYEENNGYRTYVLPPADVIVDPKQEDCRYPYKGICGAVVAWKFIQQLYVAYGISEEETKEFLQFAAMATIGDVMELRDENRIIVKLGMEQLKNRPCPGIRALMEVNSIIPEKLGSYHIGFVLGPCLNASGRLETAQHALELLLAEDGRTAGELARRLKNLNDARKSMTEDGKEAAYAQIDNSSLVDDNVLIVYLPSCHESLAGIIAGRVRERYYKPVIVFTDAEGGVKGSGRSIPGYNMFEELTKCRDLFTKYGGHPMAAGISMPKEHLETLRRMLNENQRLTQAELTEKIYIDVPMPLGYINESLIENLEVLEPFGNGNAKPVFAIKHMKILHMEQKGRERKILKLFVMDETGMIEAVYFGDIAEFEWKITQAYGREELEKAYARQKNQIDLAVLYYPSMNEYMGRRTVQITIMDISVP